jgi:plasmid stabilization system protein ParE
LEISNRKVIWAPDAELDVIGIGDYCEERFGLAVAVRVMREYETLAETLSGQPRIGKVVRGAFYRGMQVMEHPHSWCRIFYCFSETEMQILRVFDTRIHPGNPRP